MPGHFPALPCRSPALALSRGEGDMTGPAAADRRFTRAVVLVVAGLLAALVCSMPSAARAARLCKPSRALPAIVLKDMGACGFDAERLSFAGEPAEQAACLLRGTNLAQLAP